MRVTTKIDLDFCRDAIPVTVYAKQRDKDTRFVEITPRYSGTLLELPEGATARLHLTKPDKHTVLKDGVIEGGKITVELTQQALAAHGEAVAEIGIYDGESLLTSQVFGVNIEKSAYDPKDPPSGDEYDSLLGALERAEASIKAADAATEKADSAASRIEGALENVEAATEAATSAAETAKTAADGADSAAEKATASASAADKAAQNAEGAAQTATEAATSATEAARAAGEAAGEAAAAAGRADTAAGKVDEAITGASEATSAATAAASKAETAAGTADTAASKAETAAGTAETAAGKADTAAGAANTAATEAGKAKEAANTAASAANTAADAANKAKTAADEAAASATAGAGAANTAANEAKAAASKVDTAVQSAGKATEAANEAAEAARLAAIKRYGARRKITSSAPELERIWSAEGLVAEAGVGTASVVNDFDYIYPWCDMRVCNIKVEGNAITVAAYEGEAGFKRDGSNGEVAVEIPKFYQPPRYPGDGYEYYGACAIDPGGWTLNPRFVTASGVELDKIYIGAYEAYYNAAAEQKTGFTLAPGLHSITGVAPAVSCSRTDFRTRAKATAGICGLYDLATHDIVATLFTVEFATLNSQNVMYGFANGNTAALKVGETDGVTASSGSMVSNTDGKHACIYRGIENPWGNVWKWVDGVNVTEHKAWVSSNPAEYADDVFKAPYNALSYTNATANGYAKTLGCDERYPWARLTTDSSGSNVTYYSDYYYQAAGSRALFVGGAWADGLNAGLWYFHASRAASAVHAYVGARLSWKPQ